ncbi:MAG: hypothetical protein E3K36_14970 [Candidatus Brocadia sp.]|nr:hypothetical protein [Candidatus Brocadia sp.]
MKKTEWRAMKKTGLLLLMTGFLIFLANLPAPVAWGGIELEPLTATNTIDTDHTVTATVTDDSGKPPSEGISVGFDVSGNNVQTGFARIDKDGKATFTYHDNKKIAATDSIVAKILISGEKSNVVEKRWVNAGITLSQDKDENTVNTNHTVEAEVVDIAGNPAKQVTVIFLVDGSNNLRVESDTNDKGVATFTYHDNEGKPGSDTISAFSYDLVTDAIIESKNKLTKKWTEKGNAVELTSFAAKANDDGSVILTWETATEVDNAGFNLYRARLKDGTYKKINDTLIPAQGNTVSGASYSYVDTPPAKGTYYYKLEDVDYNGLSTMHGPEKVRVRSGNNASRRSR